MLCYEAARKLNSWTVKQRKTPVETRCTASEKAADWTGTKYILEIIISHIV